MKTQKQRIFSILAILTMAVILTCIFAACDKVSAQESNEISISFNSMGGSSVQSIMIEKGKTISLPTAPTKEGYVFDGWYYDENYSIAYKVSDTFTSNTTLYAKWNENKEQFTNIVFNDQTFSYDGTPHSLSISGCPEGTDVSFDIPNSQTLVGVYKITATLSKVGYETKTYSATMTIDKGIIDTSKFVFEDKEFQQDGTPKSLELIGDLPYGVTVEYINNNQTLDGVYTVTAHFVYDKNLYYEVSDMTAKMTIVTPLVSYNIHYELNKGVNSGKNPSTYLSPNENEIKLYPATRSAWIFDGWYRNENFEGSAITELPKNTSGDIYLYAKWVKPYIIAADDLFSINDKTITATVGHDVSIYSFIESFNACSDCTWSLYSDYLGKNELVLKNMQLEYGMNTAYIVVWSEDRSAFTQYTLNVYRLSMRNYSYSILDRTVDAGQIEEQSALNAPDDPDVQHYIFEGWYVGDQQISFPYNVHVDTVITAKMTPIEYDLTYVLNGGTNDDSNPATYNVENISTLMSRLQKATKDYYDFIQWSLSLEDIAKIESGELGSLTLNADFTPTVYNLIFHKDGGNYASEYKKWKSLFIDVDMAQWENCYEEWLTEKGLSAVLNKMKECNLTFSDIELAWQLVESGKEIDEVVWQPLSEEDARNAWASRVLSVVYSEFNATTPCEPEIFVLYYEFFGLCESPDAYETTYTVESNDILFESIHKNGYKFVGWYDNAEFNGEPITLISGGSHGNVELFAKWEQVTFNFVYDLDGGVNDAANPLTFTIDTFISAITNLRSSSKDYYNFKSWTCGPEDSAVEAWEADGNASLCTYSDNYCLIAKYTPIDYSITFNLGGGNLAETPVSKYNIETADLTLPIPSRTGYTFVGWFDNDQLSGEAIDCIPLGSHDDKVFYAKWQTIDYAIIYDLNDANSVSPATNSTSNPATYTIEDAVVFADPTRVGYKFTGWSISNIDVGTYGEKTITANWQIINYDITYDLNDSNSVSLATNNGTNPSTYTIEEDVTFAAPTRTGYEFAGWTLPSIAQGSTGAVSTTATWEVVNYSITYDFAIAESSKSQVVENSANPSTYTIEDAVVFADPTRAGYKFTGWSISNINVGTYGEKTITANWQIINYDITYDLNDSNSVSLATNNGTNPSTYTIEENVTFAAPTRTGYDFTGWTLPSITQGSTGAVSTTATWEVVNYSITYDFAIAESSKSQVVDNSANTVFSYTIEDEVSFNAPTRAGYTFASWDVPTIAKGTYGNKTIVASWNIIDYSITYNLNGGTNHSDNPGSFTVEKLPVMLKDADSEDDVFNSWRSTNSIDGDKITQITTIGDKTVYALFGGTEGLQYSLSSDGAYYSVSDYTGTLTDVVIGKRYNNKPVTEIGSYAFENNTNIVSIKLSDPITSIGSSAFYNCSALTSVTIGSGVTSIGGSAFYNCYKLVEVYNKSTLSITAGSYSYGYVAYYAKNVYTNEGGSKLTTDENGYVIYTDEDEKILVAYRGTNTELVLPLYITKINHYAFYNCTGLTSITIPDSVTSIGGEAFSGCTGLTTVNWNATECTSAGSNSQPMFKGCSNLATVNIGDNVKIIPSYAFRNCTGLTSVTIGNSVTSIGESTFSGCTGLTTVNWNATECTSAGSYGYPIFQGCSNLATVNIGDNVKIIPSCAFYHCTGLTSVTIPNSVTSIGVAAFYDCTGLTSITIPDSVTTIDGNAFSGCIGLTSVTIGKGVTSIGWGAFRDCTGFTSVTIGGSVTSIGSSAFYGCTGLTSITIPDSVTSIGEDAFYNCINFTKIIGSFSPASVVAKQCGSKSFEVVITSGTSIGSSAFYRCTGLTSVTIPDSVTSIGEEAFCICTGLASVTIGNGVTSIGEDAFYNCTGLTSITIPDSVTSIGGSAFYNCYRLIEVYNKSTLSITAGSSSNGCVAYYAKNVYTTEGGSKISTDENGYVIYTDEDEKILVAYLGTNTELILPSDITKINHGAFYGCSALTGITIPDSVTSIGDSAFSGCTSLTSITIPDSVTSIGSWAFYGCNNLQDIYITDIAAWCNISGLDNLMGYYDSSNKNLYINNELVSSVTIPDGVTSIPSYAFRNCSGLTNMTIPDSVTNIGSQAFQCCTGLTSVTIGNSVTSIGYEAFNNCTGLTSITVAKGNTKYHSAGNCLIETESKTLIVGCKNSIIPTDGSVTSIGEDAFYNCSGLTSVTIPDSVMSIGDGAFYDCTGLTSIIIPNSVTSIGSGAFYNTLWYNNQPNGLVYAGKVAYKYKGTMPSNTSIELKEGTLGIADSAFYGCTGLTSVTIPNSVTSIGDEAFYRCSGLTTVNWNATACTSAGSSYYPIFKGCSNLATVNIGDNVTTIPSYTFSNCTGLTNITIPDSVTSIGYDAFWGCTGLTSITIPDSVTSIGSYAFEGCSKLQDIYITDIAAWCNISGLSYLMGYGASNKKLHINNELATSITIPNGVTEISSYAFYGCRGLTSVTIPDSVTSIGGSAFSGCTGLTSITIPDSVTSIGDYAFYGCSGLKTVLYAGTEEQWKAISIGSDNSALTSATRVYNYDGVERTYSFVTNCDQSADPITAKYLPSLPTLTRDGYHFCGWYDNEAFEGEAVFAPYYSKDKTTLYAKWLTEEEWLASLDGTSFEKAFIAESGKTYDVNVTTGGQIVYFAFTPTTSGSFTIQSIGSGDTYGTLYSSTKSSLTTNDDDGDGRNFKITYTMTAGTTYYVAVKFYGSSTTGTFKVSFS